MNAIQNDLRRQGKLELGDKLLIYGGEWMLLKVGDTYLAQSEDAEPELLTVRRLEVQKRLTGLTVGKVFPKERKKKLYDLHECVKVIILDNPNPIQEKPHEHNRRQSISEGSGLEQQEPGATPRLNRPIPRDPSRERGRINYGKPAPQE